MRKDSLIKACGTCCHWHSHDDEIINRTLLVHQQGKPIAHHRSRDLDGRGQIPANVIARDRNASIAGLHVQRQTGYTIDPIGVMGNENSPPPLYADYELDGLEN